MKMQKAMLLLMSGMLVSGLCAAPAWAKKPVRSEGPLAERSIAGSEDNFDRRGMWLHQVSSGEDHEQRSARVISSDDQENVRIRPVRLSSVVDKL